MNIIRVESFAREIIAIVQQADQVRAELDKMSGYLTIAANINDLQQTKQLQDARKEGTKTLEAITKIACEKANRQDLESARTLATDLMHRVNNARREHEDFRKLASEFEFQVATGDLQGEARAIAERELEMAKQRVELRVKLADDLVPNKPVVLLGGK